MTATTNPRALFTERRASYARFIRAVDYPRGLRAFVDASALLRPDLRVLDTGCGTGVLALAVHAALARRGLRPRALHAFDLTLWSHIVEARP